MEIKFFRKTHFKILNNSHGSALIWTMAVVVCLAVIVSILPGYFTQIDRSYKGEAVKTSASMIKESLMSLLDNDAAWSQTVAHNPQLLACLSISGAVCGPANFGAIRIFDGAGNAFQTAKNEGFDLSGSKCSTFDANLGDPTCVLQYQVSWPGCSGPCPATVIPTGFLVAANPSINLTGTLIYSPIVRNLIGLINTQSSALSFNFLRGTRSKTLSKFCNSISGIFKQDSMQCQKQLYVPNTFTCVTAANPYSWFKGYDSSGTPICQDDINIHFGCHDGAGVVGYTQDGTLQCSTY